MKDLCYNIKLNKAEKQTAFVEVCFSFIGNKIADNYQEIIQELISGYKTPKSNDQALNWNMYFQIRFLDTCFPKILVTYQMNVVKSFIRTC